MLVYIWTLTYLVFKYGWKRFKVVPKHFLNLLEKDINYTPFFLDVSRVV